MKTRIPAAPAKPAQATEPKHVARSQTHQIRNEMRNEIRIIGGQWKRTKLKVADKPGLRPTPDRVRETLFNWLGQDLTGWRCMDAFAGTGALEVRLVEHDSALVDQLKKVQTQLQASNTQIIRGDGVAALKAINANSMDLILLDPPFDSGLYDTAVHAAGRAVTATGFVYLEAAAKWTDAQLEAANLVIHRHLKAGAVHAHLLQRIAA